MSVADTPGLGHAYQAGATLRQTPTTLLRRGTRSSDGAPVLLESLPPDAGAAAISRLRHAYQLNTRLMDTGICRALDLVWLDGRLTLVFEDAGGISLRDWLASRPALAQRAQAAVHLARAVERLHSVGVILGDLNPDGMLIRAGDLAVQIRDLGLATLLRNHAPDPVHPRDLQGTLPYLAPEQTGRLGRSVDQRAVHCRSAAVG